MRPAQQANFWQYSLCFIAREKIVKNLEFGQSGHSMFDVSIGGYQFKPPMTPNLCIWIHHSEFDTSRAVKPSTIDGGRWVMLKTCNKNLSNLGTKIRHEFLWSVIYSEISLLL
jgi:hypothetical protein